MPSSGSTTTPSIRRSSPQIRSTSAASCTPSTQIRLALATWARTSSTAIEPEAVRRRAGRRRRRRRPAQRHRPPVEQERGRAAAGSCAAGRAGPPAPPRPDSKPTTAPQNPESASSTTRSGSASTSGIDLPPPPVARQHVLAVSPRHVDTLTPAPAPRRAIRPAHAPPPAPVRAEGPTSGSETGPADTYPFCMSPPQRARPPWPRAGRAGSWPGYAPGAPAWCRSTRSPTRSPATRSTSSPTPPAPGPTCRCGDALPALAKLSPDEIRLVLPAPGDPRGLPGPGDFAGAALLAGEAWWPAGSG